MDSASFNPLPDQFEAGTAKNLRAESFSKERMDGIIV
jgi:hypothetical protein